MDFRSRSSISHSYPTRRLKVGFLEIWRKRAHYRQPSAFWSSRALHDHHNTRCQLLPSERSWCHVGPPLIAINHQPSLVWHPRGVQDGSWCGYDNEAMAFKCNALQSDKSFQDNGSRDKTCQTNITTFIWGIFVLAQYFYGVTSSPCTIKRWPDATANHIIYRER